MSHFMNPVIEALKRKGGSASNEELTNEVSIIMHLSDNQLETLHEPEKSSRTEVEYRIAWAKTALKNAGIIEKTSRGVWALTSTGLKIEKFDPKEIRKNGRDMKKGIIKSEEKIGVEEEIDDWREKLLTTIQQIPPDAFERLTQRLLREAGFVQVEVTGRSKDGGIDGRGILRLGGVLSFKIIFQCKRYKGSVPPSEIRDFRGAMVGRADKGVFLTTGNFTSEAKKEAVREGAPLIDLIDGDQLVELLRQYDIGIKKETVEKISVIENVFNEI